HNVVHLPCFRSTTPRIIMNILLYRPLFIFFFFFNDTATTEIYTLSLHDALPISVSFALNRRRGEEWRALSRPTSASASSSATSRSEEHTSELQSRGHLVCRLLLEKKKND